MCCEPFHWSHWKSFSDRSFSTFVAFAVTSYSLATEFFKIFLAEIGKSKAILSRENIYGEYSIVVTLCLARYCLTCNDWCARGFVQKKLSCLVHPFPQTFPYISNTKNFDYMNNQRLLLYIEEINCKCDKNIENIRTWMLSRNAFKH